MLVGLVGTASAFLTPLRTTPRRGTLVQLRGGAILASETPSIPPQTPPTAFANGGGRAALYAACLMAIAGWLAISTMAYSMSEDWPVAQSIFYSVDVGMGIGFGAFVEKFQRTKMFSCVHMLMCASGVAGALALFTEALLADAATLAAMEYADAAIISAFERADTSHDGQLSHLELEQALISLGIQLSDNELNLAFGRFDHNCDGQISTSEFARAVRPHLKGTDLADAVRLAIVDGERSVASRWLRSAAHALLFKHRTLLVWALWVALGTTWGIVHQGWDGLTSLYSSLSALTTSGLQAPSLDAAGHVPASSSLFLAAYCLFGIPIMGLAMGHFAGIFVEKMAADKERKALTRPLTDGEFDVAEKLFVDDGKVDFGEFLALELMRLGRVDMGTLKLLKQEFGRLDTDHSGTLSKAEAMAWRTAEPVSA